MFSFLRKETVPVQVYGKLPIAKDYLRVGCSEGNAHALRQWMDQAFSTGADESNLPEPAWPMRFLLASSSGAPVQGCFWPSSDSAGLRRFPFAVLAERSARALLKDLEEGLGRSAGVWRELQLLGERAESHGDGQGFLSAMRRCKVSVGDPDPPRTVDASTWAQALWPGEGVLGLVPVFERLRDYKNWGQREPLRLPLVPNLSLSAQTHAWWRLLVRAQILVASRAPSLFFPQTEPDPGQIPFLTVFCGPLRASDTAWLTRPVPGRAAGPSDLVRAAPRMAEVSGTAPHRPLADGLVDAWSEQGD